MERKFDEELQELKKMIFEMLSLVNELMENAVTALIQKNEKLAEEVEKRDEEVDDYENKIDKFCLELLVKYQPAAIDLRFITSIMKINNDVERIGDLTTTIAHKAGIITRQHPAEIPAKINEINKEIQKMLKGVTVSLMDVNPEKALTICVNDRSIDEMYVETFRQIMGFMMENKLNVKAGIELILSIKNLERIADHLTNIAEDIVYMAKGESIKHKKEI